MDRINAAIALNRNVLYPAYVMIRSLVRNNNSYPIYLYVLHSELNAEYFKFLQDALMRGASAENYIEFIKIDSSKVSGLPCTQTWSLEMYYRLMLPELLGDKIDRILYLDVDIIVNKDIYDFYSMDFEGNLLIASKDMVSDSILARDEAVEDKAEPEYRIWHTFFNNLSKKGMTYFCSGILLMNLLKLKEEYTFKKYMEIFNTIVHKVQFPDQDLLNYVHYRQVKLVDELQIGLYASTAHEMGMTYEDVRMNVSILHFAGPAKPWTINLIRYDIQKVWWDYAKDAPFYRELLEMVFYHSMDSRLAEEKIQLLKTENEELRGLLNKCQVIIQNLSSGI